MGISSLERIGMASLFFVGCGTTTVDQDIGNTCKAVHDVVFELNRNPIYSGPKVLQEAEERAKVAQAECETLDPKEQKKLLRSYVVALSVTRTSY